MASVPGTYHNRTPPPPGGPFSVKSVYRAIVFCSKTKIVGTAFSWRGGSNVYQQSIFEQKNLHIACASFRNEKSVIQVSFNCNHFINLLCFFFLCGQSGYNAAHNDIPLELFCFGNRQMQIHSGSNLVL